VGVKPVRFPEQNVVYAKDQPEYLPLPALRGPSPEHVVVSRWAFSWRERLKILVFGKMWLSSLTFGGALQPLLPEVDRPELLPPSKGIRFGARVAMVWTVLELRVLGRLARLLWPAEAGRGKRGRS
jgi:hypothetical protein